MDQMVNILLSIDKVHTEGHRALDLGLRLGEYYLIKLILNTCLNLLFWHIRSQNVNYDNIFKQEN